MSEWSKVFAWLPVWVSDNECRWLQWVERKRETIGGVGGVFVFDSYRALGSTRP